MEKTRKTMSTSTIVGTGLLIAIVVVLQFISMYFLRFATFSITLTLLPIVVGVALYGKTAGAILGLAFGIAVLLTGDANAFLQINAPGTIITVLLKGALAGFCSGLVYSLISKKNHTAAVIAAAVTAPVVNTGIFALGYFVFFANTPEVIAMAEGAGVDIVTLLFVGMIGGNFFIELGINIVFNPVIMYLIKLGRKTIANKA